MILAANMGAWGSLLMDYLGTGPSVLRALVSYLYLTFVPGFALFPILKARVRSVTVAMLYVVGLSLSTLMLAGLVQNESFLALGIARPLGTIPLLATMSTVSLLGVGATIWLRLSPFDELSNSLALLRSKIDPRSCMFFAMLPILGVLGALILNSTGNNSVMMILLVLVAATPIFVVFGKAIPDSSYAAGIYAVALALLWHHSLVSNYLVGFDIQSEYYVQTQTLITGSWNPYFPNVINGMISVSILGPAYAAVTGMNLVIVDKAVYPSLFALAPLALFEAIRRQTTPE